MNGSKTLYSTGSITWSKSIISMVSESTPFQRFLNGFGKCFLTLLVFTLSEKSLMEELVMSLITKITLTPLLTILYTSPSNPSSDKNTLCLNWSQNSKISIKISKTPQSWEFSSIITITLDSLILNKTNKDSNPLQSLDFSLVIISLRLGGIPIVYYGSEQMFNGGNDPYNREPLWRRMDKQ